MFGNFFSKFAIFLRRDYHQDRSRGCSHHHQLNDCILQHRLDFLSSFRCYSLDICECNVLVFFQSILNIGIEGNLVFDVLYFDIVDI